MQGHRPTAAVDIARAVPQPDHAVLVPGQSPAAVFSLNDLAFQSGGSLGYQATLLPGTGQPPLVDIYLGARRPDGVFVSLISVPPNGTGVAVGAAPMPFATGVSLSQPIVVPFAYGFKVAAKEPRTGV